MIYKQINNISKKEIKKKLNKFFNEDDIKNDITTNTFVDKKKTMKVSFIAEFEGVFCGEKIIEAAFSKKVKTTVFIKDGFKVKDNFKIATVEGPSFEILRKERVVLNLIQRMSGVASETNRYVVKAYRKNIKILDTRKTTPGLRIFEKYAVFCGGGKNHRLNLSKGIMIKDNHVGSNTNIEETLYKKKSNNLPFQVEVDTLEQLKKCLKHKIDAVLLDNMDPGTIKKCISLIKETNKKVFIEVSGGITYKNLNKYLVLGVDAISVGAIIHQATFKNIKLEVS
ncbi:MAG: nicotinate-nucleotide diphosphorylase (carboxylating) [Candidatus Marinimicrobia bacterium]|nr:nicotinate-nucleotide diphosphorylase (carboxylating) [Candidatus Neomarinimicrobiota bacterium]